MTAALKAVKSSSITAIGFDEASKILTVQFNSGKVFRYPGVSADVHSTLMAAASIGGHFAKHIRPHHKGELVEGQPS